MRLAAIYNVFDGEELLEGSIKQIREHVDYIICMTQTISNRGEKYEGGHNECLRLKELGLVDKVEQVFVKTNQNPSVSETNKRSLGVQMVKRYGYTHFISMDCDEYYDSKEFLAAKTKIINRGFRNTVVKLKTYCGDPTLQLTPDEDYYVQFISEVGKIGNFNNGFYCDPTRKTPIKAILLNEIKMHHYSWVRKDLSRKIDNSSANINLKNYKNDLIQFMAEPKEGIEVPFYKGHTLKKVENRFNIQGFL